MSSSTHKELFNFLLLQDKEDDEGEEDDAKKDETLDLIMGRDIVTRSCGNTLGGFLWLLSITSSCINW